MKKRTKLPLLELPSKSHYVKNNEPQMEESDSFDSDEDFQSDPSIEEKLPR